MKKMPFPQIILISVLILFSSCSINKMAINMAADVLGSVGGGTVFTGDEDPELIKEALPFALKIYEALLESAPDNYDLLLTTGTGFISYANAFVQTPAGMLPDEEFEKQIEMNQRAKKLYIRGRNYVLRGIELKHPGFTELFNDKKFEEALEPMKDRDIPALYWAGAGWIGAISIDVFDTALTMTACNAVALITRAFQLNPEYGAGSLHELLISINASLPEHMMYRQYDPEKSDQIKAFYDNYYSGLQSGLPAKEARVRHHFDEVVSLSGDSKAGPYVSLSLAVSVKNNDADEYRMLLEKAISIDTDKSPENRLLNVLAQRKAEWLLKHIDDYFLIF